MAEFGKYSAFDTNNGARSLEEQYVEVAKSKPRFGYQHTPFFKKQLE